MNMLFRRAARLIAIGVFALSIPALASSPDIESAKGFKLAMGPASAAQKNQGRGMTEQSGSVEVKPHHHRITHHRRHH